METYRRGRNELDSKSSCPQGHVGSNPTVSAMKAPERLSFGAFFLLFCGARFLSFFSNGARNAPICGARRKVLYLLYAVKMYVVVPEWCPKLLKTYRNQLGV